MRTRKKRKQGKTDRYCGVVFSLLFPQPAEIEKREKILEEVEAQTIGGAREREGRRSILYLL